VLIIAAATIWGLWSCFMIFPIAGLPAYFHRLAMTLLVAELGALGLWSYYAGQECVREPCDSFGRELAMVEIPLSGVGLVAVAVIYGLSRRPVG
jgi:hypothetical protein